MNNRMKLILIVLFAIANLSIASGQQKLKWQQIHPGIWKATVGQPEAVTLLQAADVKANVQALNALPATGFPLPEHKIDVKIIDQKVYLRFPLEREEQVFGLGLNYKTINQRNRILTLHVDHYGNADNGRTHAPVPFYVSSNGYGVLIDAARYITVYAGTGVRVDSEDPPVLYDRNTHKDWDPQPYSDAVEVLVPAGHAEIYVFSGPTPMNVVQRYNLMNGGGYLPPKWGLGFTHRVPTLYSQEDILREAAEFEKHDFPLDFIGVEPGWHSMAYPCTFEWDATRFPDPKGFIDKLAIKGISTNLWLNPYISPTATLYPRLKHLSGSHTVWNGIVPDFTLPEVREIFREHFMKHHLSIGVGGYKVDEVDGYDFWLWPDVATFPSGTAAEQMRQVYGTLFQRMTAGWFREINQRTYGLVRASNAGASSFPYVIYNDYYSHRDFITALINSSFIGVLWTPEVRSSKTAEEWLRRMQSVCFSPMAMLNAWADGTKPWSFPEVEKAVRDVANLRMQLLPYIYTTFAQYHFQGIPPFRAMNLVEGFAWSPATIRGDLDATDNPYVMRTKDDIKDQYMMGDYILVAPMFAGQESRTVVLPEGKWYDFYTGEPAGENEVIEVNPGMERIPLFVKNGGIIPMVPAMRHAPAPEIKLPLEIRHYGTAAGNFDLYDDDGRTFNFEKGEFSKTSFRVERDKKGVLTGRMSKPEAGKPFGYEDKVTWKFMTDIETAYSDGRPATNLRMDAKDHGIVLKYGDGPDECDILGARDVWVFEDKGTYYMHYDASGPKGWVSALAISKDLVNWDKKGPILDFGEPGEEDSKSAAYGVTYLDGEQWHMFYLGTPNVSPAPDLVPSFPYLTMKAKGDGPAGPWVKQKDVVPFRTKPGTYYSITASPGQVIKQGKEYLQFFSATTEKEGNPCVQRTLGIARTYSLDGSWTIDPEPMVPIEEQIENSTLYFEKSINTWFLFTNHIGIENGHEYTDAIWVYWTKNLNKWNPANKAVVLDGKNCTWSEKCIGLPSVVKAGNRLALFYDAPGGNSTSHMKRSVGLAWLDLPLSIPEK